MKTIYHNGVIYTGELPLVTAFAVENDKFTAVGSDADILASRCDDDTVIDLKGQFVCAGFNDSHMHLLNYGYALTVAPLHEHTRSLADMLACLRDHLAAHPVRPGEYLLGRGWNQDYFSDEHRLPTREDLDSVSRDIPIIITRACGHIGCANTAAIRMAGFTADTPQPEGGHFDIVNGELTGIFRENALSMVKEPIPAPDASAIANMIRTAARALNSYGITSSQTDDLPVFPVDPEVIHAAYRSLADAGELTVRVNEQAHFCDTESLSAYIAAGHVTGEGDEFFRVGPLKMLGDGSLGAGTAYMSRPYADQPDNRGIAIYTGDQFRAMIELAHTHHMQVAIHAIGDGILDDILDAYEDVLTRHPRADHRHGVVHCQITRPDQLERMKKLQLHAYVQSIFLDYDNRIVRRRVGDMADTSYAFRTLKEQYHASNGSDCPVELPNVLGGIQCGVTRNTLSGDALYRPEEAFTVQQAIDTFTSEGAFASREEHIKGRIQPGMLADFVILGGNPFSVPASEIARIPVLQTVLGGKTVYQR